MNLNDAKIEIIDAAEAGNAVLLESAPGVGKSELIEQIVGELSERDGEPWGLATMFLATQTPPDLIGYVFKGERNWGGEIIPVTEPTMPLWMITRDGKPVSAYKRGFLFLDEYGQGEADVKRASAELLLNKRLGPWRLPDGWAIVAASNRSEDRSGVTKSFDFVINRIKTIKVTAELAPWNDWAIQHGVMPLTIAFANQHPHIVFSGEVPDKQRPWCTPRSLVKADRELQVKARRNGGDVPDDPRTIEGIGGIIGPGEASSLFAFVKLERQMPKYEKIVADPKGVRVPEKPDAQMLVIYNLAHRVDDKDIGPVVTYVQRFPKEFAVTFLKAACKRKSSFAAHPAVNKWALENASLVSGIALP